MRKYSDELHSEISYLFNIGLWVFLFSFKLCTVNYICESVMVKVKLCNPRKYILFYNKFHILG